MRDGLANTIISKLVMPGLVPGIHVFLLGDIDVDGGP
jgi:hypothetical protein